ncbi:MAG TPA: mechanosensitive ion channel domain-containing protein [Chthoniobacterales bacterium]|nr:mechanosensitive ion channel domain-containing protein [Chthoniobacterales bacterium]
MNASGTLCALLSVAICMSAMAAEPSATPSPSASVAESPAPTIAQSFTELSAQSAAADRSKIYRAGVDYSKWLDQVAKDSGSAFLQRTVFERVTWMRFLAAVAALALLSILAGSFVWIVRRRAGEIQSRKYQSALQLAASALRKPFALFIWMCGGAFALMPIATGIIGRPTRIFYVGLLTAILYAGWIIALLWLAFRAVLAVEKRMNQWADRTGSVIGKVIIPIAGHTLRLAVPLLGVILLLPLLRLPENWTWAIDKGFGILLIVAFSVLIVRGVNAVQSALMSRHRLDAPDNLSARKIFTQVSVIRKIIVTAVVIIATGSILMMFDPVRQFGTSILASAGIAGIVIGFAAQKTLGNVLAGIQIALTQPLLIDDIVVVDGEFGQIEEITLTYVTVRTWDLRRLVVPITQFVEKPFQNWSRVSTELLGTVILYLDYQAPMGELRKELKRLVENHPKWDKRVCGLQVTDTKEHVIEVRALISGSDPGKLGDLRCDVREGLIQFLVRNYPESLPRSRNVAVEDTVSLARTRERKDDTALPGQQHERGDKSPGVHADEKGDGQI